MAIRALNPLLAFHRIPLRSVLFWPAAREKAQNWVWSKNRQVLSVVEGSGATNCSRSSKFGCGRNFNRNSPLWRPSSIGGAMAVECAARRLFSLSWSGGQLGVGRPQPRRPSRDPCPSFERLWQPKMNVFTFDPQLGQIESYAPSP